MHHIFSIIILALLVVWLFTALQHFMSAKKDRGWRRFIGLLAATCIALGAIGFFGSALSATGGLNWLPSSFEWPAGLVKGVVLTEDHFFVVPLNPSGRVQIYDSNWKFVRGWHVDAGGGIFKLNISDTNHIHVMTARGRHHYVYDVNGTLLSSENQAETGYLPLPSEGDSYVVPTWPWLWVFSSPFLSWLTAAIGLVLFIAKKKLSRGAK